MATDPAKVEDLFEAARSLPRDQRASYLAKACGADSELRAAVESLLGAHDVAGDFLEPTAVHPNLDPPLMFAAPGSMIGRYKLLEPIGEGGYGAVFMAEQTSPVQRKVALKIIKAGMDTRQVIARFEAERQALALMDHPNIARVFDAGTTDTGRPYFVMELVKGMPITRYCDEHHIEPRQRLELFMQVCQAVQHAHQKGIIHRDIKPNNVLVAQYDGKPVPKVIDFGVAKATGQQLTDATMFTGFGDVIGTLEYMSPEQAEVNQLDVDTRSDIYSLGVLLYELLTGSTPLEHKRVMKAGLLEMLRLVREEEPPRPSMRLSTSEQLPSIAANRGVEPKALSGLVHGDLDWIVMKSLEKDRSRRYETANGLAMDLQRYLADEAVEAYPPSATYRFRKFARRNKAMLVTGGLIAAMLVIAVAILAVSNARVRREVAAKQLALQQKDVALQEKEGALKDRDQALGVARDKESLAQSRFYAAQMNLAQRAWDGGEQARTIELLETMRPQESGPDLRGIEWHYLYQLSHPNLIRTWQAHTKIVTGIAWSPDGSMFATCSWDGRVRLWDGRTSEDLGDLTGNGRCNAWAVAFSPDGKLLALACDQPSGELVVWDVITRKERWRRAAHPVEHGIRSLAFSPDGRVIATGAQDVPSNPNLGSIKLWNADDGKLLATVQDHKESAQSLAFSPDGKALASADPVWVKDGSIILWDLKLPAVAKKWEVKNAGATDCIFSEDGHTLLAGKRDGVQVIEVSTGRLGPFVRTDSAGFNVMRQVPGKKQLVTASNDRTIRLWDLETTKSSVLGVELTSVTALAIEPKGERIACGDDRGWVSLRTLDQPRIPQSSLGTGTFESIAFAGDGRSLIVAGSSLCVLDASTLEVRTADREKALAVSPVNMLAAIHDPANQRCTIWDITSRKRGPSMEVGAMDQARFSPDGKLLATWDAWQSTILQLWNTTTGERIERFAFDSDQLARYASAISVMCVAFSPDGRYLAAGLAHRRIALYDMARKTWAIHTFSDGLDTAVVMDYSPDGNTLAAGLDLGGAILFDVDQQSGWLKFRSRLDGSTRPVKSMAFSPDSRTLITATLDGSVRFSDVATGQERATMQMAAKSLALSPDGKQFAIVDDKATVRVISVGAGPAMEQKNGR